jgi:hypothetical protein
VDVNPTCEIILKEAYENKKLKINGKLEICNNDGLEFLHGYDGRPIDFLFLDAWDVIPGTDYAEKHLEAYEIVFEHLNENICFLAIDDTDIAAGGKGRLLIPRLIKDHWIMLYNGRQSIFYKGNVEKLIECNH